MRRQIRAANVHTPDIMQMADRPKFDHMIPPRNAPATRPIPAKAKNADMVEALNSGISSVDKLTEVTMVNSKVKKTRKSPART